VTSLRVNRDDCVCKAKTLKLTVMGKGKWTEDHFAKRLRAEREHRGWSQAEMAKMLSGKGIAMHWTTIAKIEKSDRSVRIDEAAGIADLFDTSVDALLGRKVRPGNDLAYTLRAVLNTARQSAEQTAAIADALGDNLVDLDALEFNGREELENEVVRAQRDLLKAQAALSNVAKFKLPPRGRVALRKDLVMPETRTVLIAKGADDEA
jgi:transcriptional regulator with XRE-family HTH domain